MFFSALIETRCTIVAEIEAEQALVSANHELIHRMEAKVKAAIDRVWEKSSDNNGNVAGTPARTVFDSVKPAAWPVGAVSDTKRHNDAAIEGNRLDKTGGNSCRRADKPANDAGANTLTSGKNQFQASYTPYSSRSLGLVYPKSSTYIKRLKLTHYGSTTHYRCND